MWAVLVMWQMLPDHDVFIVFLVFSLFTLLLHELQVWQPFKYRRWHKLRRNGGSHLHSEWIMVKWRQEYKCASCGKRAPLTKDHIVPVSRGGTDNISNIQGLCQSCNSAKGTHIIDFRH